MISQQIIDSPIIAIIGLGYVGLPLAVEFSKKHKTTGFDIDHGRIEELRKGFDRTLEVNEEELGSAKGLAFTTNLRDIEDCNYYIVTVPTPIDKHKRPNLQPLLEASRIVGKVIKKGDLVIYESTVYPGCTEEECVPVIEKESGLIFNSDFFCGYSPERLNPGDRNHTVTKIVKVTSGSTSEVAEKVDILYRGIIEAGTYRASSIRVAEAAKVIENAQRDINIAFVNELAIIFNKLGINTKDVLEAAMTKWNFLPFKPGLVGGHCIGVDPYYLTHKAEELGYNPEIILAGRRINDNMGIYVANQVIKLMIQKGQKIEGAYVLVMGITFKENCPDIRNSKVIDVIDELKEYCCNVDVFDPWADKMAVREEYHLDLLDCSSSLEDKHYDAIVLAVAHDEFKKMDISSLKNNNCVVYDIKNVLSNYDDKDGLYNTL
ncbi:MAG: Vi polysaccharide biosynthesis UDP-N-acetylglucosamine C-6 dehydrogenase TviB [Spirochaetota bacterium]|nr:Vi polysaccharide biosynthesis UDP-N-acetylglucosamine C-6 dehydrogenase TviB [Spirochaetota bacterium]